MALRAATRGSALARWQTDHVAALLGVEVEVVVVETEGDRRTDVPISQIGGQGVFAKEVQAAVLDGRADFAVHSAKDLTSTTVDGLYLAAIPERGDPHDCLVGQRLDQLEAGAVVATGSVRRRAQLAHLRPDLAFADVRGNIDTRLSKAPEFGALVMAYAALIRLERTDAAAEVLHPTVMLPQVGQGALAIECRFDDEVTRQLLADIEHRPSRLAVDAERAYLAQLGGGCDLPAGAYATVEDELIRIEALLSGIDGRIAIRAHAEGTDPVAVGRAVAQRVLVDCGGSSLMGDLIDPVVTGSK